MQSRSLGHSGLKVTPLCLGTMTFGHQADAAESAAIMDRAWDYGVQFFDTADAYPVPPQAATAGGTERIIGDWLARHGPERRQRLVLATKCRFPMGDGPNDGGLSRRHIVEACEASLRRLRTGWIDLYQVHSPDPSTPIEETLSALDNLIRQGKVRYIGCSNFAAWQLALSLGASARLGAERFVSIQPRYNLLSREIEAELLPLCRDQGIGVVAYNPLAGGLLTGKYQPGESPREGTRFALGGQYGAIYRERYWQQAYLEAATRLKEYCAHRGISLAQMAVAWLIAQPGITAAIVGSSRAAQLDQTLPASSLELTAEDQAACEAAWYHLPRRPPAAGGVRMERNS